MGIIRVLPSSLINRIAAGECVERPSSVVKELVENALDAGAGRIDITIADGGRELIQVTDDGGGMDADDLLLSVAQHATSKIRIDDDLFNIHTMGFRGEALASISSVARVTITTRRRESDVGSTIRADGGEITGPTPCASAPGTTVEVRDLFYCVPARRKFLKTNQTEMGHISEQFARIALAHPGVAFSLRHNGRVFHQLGGVEARQQRIADFFGPELANVLLPFRREGDGVIIEGYVAPPAESRGSGKWEYVFVNGRFIRDRFVSHAVKESYRSLIDPSRYPVAFLFITIDPERVDVNVHPTKIEVRWRDSNYIHGQVLAALREKFQRTNLDHALRTPGEEDQYRERVRQAMVEFFTRTPSATQSTQRPLFAEAPARTDYAPPSEPRAQASGPVRELPPEPRAHASGPVATPHSSPPPLAGGPLPDSASAFHQPDAAISQPAHAEPHATLPQSPPPAIQMHNMFILVETADGLMIIDQHALHERILYEEFRGRIAHKTLESQRMLIPEVIRVPPDRLEALETHAETLARLGIELSQSGPESVAIQSFPSFLLERVERDRFIIDLLDLLSEKGARPAEDTLLHDILDMMACKAAVKAGDPLTRDEIDALLARREQAERSSHCPHGRPTTLHLSIRDLERQFKRR